MTIELSDEQVIKMGKLAILASTPVGLGILHYDSNLKEDDIELEIKNQRLSIDYYMGRMVKFHAKKVLDNKWEFSDEISNEYQSWKMRYGSYKMLSELAK